MMPAPKLSVVLTTTARISAVDGKDTCDVVFESDQGLLEWEARAGGTGIRQGLLVGFSPITTWDQLDQISLQFDYAETVRLTWNDIDVLTEFDDVEHVEFEQIERPWYQVEGYEVMPANGQAVFRIDNEELTCGDLTYRINVYGKNVWGEWTSYDE